MQLQRTKIRTDGGTQPRASYHFGVAESYAEDMDAGAVFPPVTVFYDGTDYWLADGFHRLLAAEKLEQTEIEADVRQGTQQDAQWYSYSVNQTHGLRRTNDDKKRAVIAALSHPKGTEMSDNQIAAHCGVGQPTVSRYRAELETTYSKNKSPIRTGKDGRTYNTANIGKKKKPQQSTPAPVQHSNGTESKDDEPLTPYEEQIAQQYAQSTTISEPASATPGQITEEVNRLIYKYNYEDLRRILTELAERLAVDV
jgi:hypothetical protein